MPLPHVADGDPHAAAHNAERDAINAGTEDTGRRQIHKTGIQRATGPTTADVYFQISRVGSRVEFFGVGGDLTKVDVINGLIPTGFKPCPGSYINFTYLNTGVDPPTAKCIQFSDSGDAYFLGETGVQYNNSQLFENIGNLVVTWRTEDPWPETLPGTIPE